MQKASLWTAELLPSRPPKKTSPPPLLPPVIALPKHSSSLAKRKLSSSFFHFFSPRHVGQSVWKSISISTPASPKDFFWVTGRVRGQTAGDSGWRWVTKIPLTSDSYREEMKITMGNASFTIEKPLEKGRVIYICSDCFYLHAFPNFFRFQTFQDINNK